MDGRMAMLTIPSVIIDHTPYYSILTIGQDLYLWRGAHWKTRGVSVVPIHINSDVNRSHRRTSVDTVLLRRGY